jgi:hypothetical protein
MNCSSAREYLNKISFDIDLTTLYKDHSSCHYSFLDEICPVIVELGDEMLNLDGIDAQFPFLLQVWNKKCQLIFER